MKFPGWEGYSLGCKGYPALLLGQWSKLPCSSIGRDYVGGCAWFLLDFSPLVPFPFANLTPWSFFVIHCNGECNSFAESCLFSKTLSLRVAWETLIHGSCPTNDYSLVNIIFCRMTSEGNWGAIRDGRNRRVHCFGEQRADGSMCGGEKRTEEDVPRG